MPVKSYTNENSYQVKSYPRQLALMNHEGLSNLSYD